MRTLTVAAFAAASLVLPTAPAHAVPTCHGQPATIEATGTGDTYGTDGPDVIVAEPGADLIAMNRIFALAGDDLICVVGGTSTTDWILVDGGPGADLIDTTASVAPPGVTTGTGPDVVLGGANNENVTVTPDHDADVITTGAGQDSLYASGEIGGDSFDLGPGRDFLGLREPVAFVPSGIDLGAGRDRVWVDDRRANVLVDLRKRRIELRKGRSALRHVEDVYFTVKRIALRGDAARNTVDGAACRASLRGGDGSDTMNVTTVPPAVGGPRCSSVRAFLFGEGGNDTLRGSPGDDVLVGGGGRDEARGQGGSDRCSAEKVGSTCERVVSGRVLENAL